MSLFKKLLGMKDIEVSGQLHAGKLVERFEESFGTVIRVYRPSSDGSINTGRGSRLADPKATLASLCVVNCKVATITLRKSDTVDAVEKAFAEKMGIGVQVMMPDGKSFAPQNMKLSDVAAA